MSLLMALALAVVVVEVVVVVVRRVTVMQCSAAQHPVVGQEGEAVGAESPLLLLPRAMLGPATPLPLPPPQATEPLAWGPPSSTVVRRPAATPL